MIGAILGINMTTLSSNNAVNSMLSFGCTPLRPRDEVSLANNKLSYMANEVLSESYKKILDKNIKSSFNIFA